MSHAVEIERVRLASAVMLFVDARGPMTAVDIATAVKVDIQKAREVIGLLVSQKRLAVTGGKPPRYGKCQRWVDGAVKARRAEATESWWVGKDRAELQEAIKKREIEAGWSKGDQETEMAS